MKNIAVILAAGSSKRCGFDKLLTEDFGIPVLERTLALFSASESIDEIILVSSAENFDQATVYKDQFSKITKVLPGGSERFESFQMAMNYLYTSSAQNCRVIVHNGANPNLLASELEEGIALSQTQKNVIFGYFTPNSIKQVRDRKVVQLLDRSEIFETQTPQISDKDTFVRALEVYADGNRKRPKDEAELLSMIGEEISVYECSPQNQKVTFASDFEKLGGKILIGIGEDSHRFADSFETDKPFRLGDIDVSGNKLTSDGNSDGDVILHTLCNALLSAFGDQTFDRIADPICKAGDTNSSSYLKATLDHIQKNYGNFQIQQIQISLEGAQPRISPHHEKITKSLSKLMNTKIDQIGLTYTTGEGLTDFGEGLGIRCSGIVILQKV